MYQKSAMIIMFAQFVLSASHCSFDDHESSGPGLHTAELTLHQSFFNGCFSYLVRLTAIRAPQARIGTSIEHLSNMEIKSDGHLVNRRYPYQ